MSNHFKKSLLIGFSFVFVLIFEDVFAQKSYSISELTGKGELNLIGSDNRLQKEAYMAYIKMYNAAYTEGIYIDIISAYRSFNSQLKIWNRKYQDFVDQGYSPKQSVYKIIEYSTLPGTSRHHWGTEIDIIDGNVRRPQNVLHPKNYEDGGAFFKMKKWMDANSEKFGFYLVYTDTKGRTGIKFEPWHYSYMPLSKACLEEFVRLDFQDFYNSIHINGKEYITQEFLNSYLKEYIFDINPHLK